MPGRIFLHVGPPKTGTTHLQSLLYANQAALRERGLHVVGTQGELHDAANELTGLLPRRGAQVPTGAWAELCAVVAAQPGDVLLSCERFSLLRREHAERVLASAFGEAALHVVLTLRDGTAVLPSRWQERIKNGGTETWPEFCDRVVRDPRFRARMTRMELPLDTWTGLLPTERIHIVTVPPPGSPRSLLVERFCAVVGAAPEWLTAASSARGNRSMDLAAAELVRRLNAREGSEIPPRVQHTEIRGFLAEEVLVDLGGQRIVVSPEAFDATRAAQQRLVERIRETGYPVTGDLADLTCMPRPAAAPDAGAAGEELLDLALLSLDALARRSYRHRRRLLTLEQAPPRPVLPVRRLLAGVRRRLPLGRDDRSEP